jgi:anti-anti-sigma factor
MKMDISEEDGVTKVGLVGRLDTPGVDAIETRLTAAVVPAGARAIVDLSGVEFIGSLGLRMLITIARALTRRSGKMVLYAPRGFVAEVLETASLGDIIPVQPDAAAALAAVRG